MDFFILMNKIATVQWQLLHVEKEIRHNNNKTLETKEKSIRKAFLFKTLVKKTLRIVPRKNICFWFCWLGLCLLFLYDFCHSSKKLAAVTRFSSLAI
jgi:hypothetical protein